MSRLRAFTVSIFATLVVTLVLAASSARAHATGSHAGFQSTVSYVEPQLPGLLVRVLGGHERLSVRNWTRKEIVILDERGRPIVRLAPGESRAWIEPRIGSAGPPPDRERLVRNWRIRGRADGRPFAIVGFLGYRPLSSDTDADDVPAWVVVVAVGTGVLAAAALALPVLRREDEGEVERETATGR
jgi:hypothetical protein